MHVDDLGSAVVFALENWNPSNNIGPFDKSGNPLYYLNVGTGKEISIMELAEKIAKISKFKGEIFWDNTKPDGTPRKLLKINRILSLGWEPKIKLSDGIRETMNSLKIENFIEKTIGNNLTELFIKQYFYANKKR